MELKLDDIAAHLQGIKNTQGEEAYQTAVQGIAKQLLAGGDQTSEFLSQLLTKLGTELDLGPLQAEANEIKQKREAAKEQPPVPNQDMNQGMMEALQRQMPNLKTQAQFDLAMRSFEALQHYMDAAFGCDIPKAKILREGLEMVFDLAPKLGEVTEQVGDTPEAVSNSDYVQPPKQFTEHVNQKRLMEELDKIGTMDELTQWYSDNKSVMDGIVSTRLRNELFDAIRVKKNGYSN